MGADGVVHRQFDLDLLRAAAARKPVQLTVPTEDRNVGMRHAQVANGMVLKVRELLRRPAADGHPEDVRVTRALGNEPDRALIRGPRRMTILRFVIGELHVPAAFEINAPDVPRDR